MTSGRESPTPSRDHYSYSYYARRDVADEFDATRFGGPIGRYLLETQNAFILQAVAPVAGKRVVDVGAGTGRAAIGLAAAGATAFALDASAEMMRVARTRAGEMHVRIALALADAHALPLASRSADAAVCLRVLMHATNWRRCIAEVCRVARWRVVVDFPALRSLAALQSGTRHVARAFGSSVENYRVLRESDVAAAFEQHGFRVVDVHRQFVLPIAMHKAIGRLGVTRSVEGALSAVGLLRLFGSPVTMVAER